MMVRRSRSESPVRRTSRRRRSRSRSRSRSRNRGADMGDMSYEQYLEAFEKVTARQSLSLSRCDVCSNVSGVCGHSCCSRIV